MPNFGYWSFANEQLTKEIAATEVDFANKKKQVVWRGALKTNNEVKELIRTTAGKDWADVSAMERQDLKGKMDGEETALPMAEYCRYQFVLQTEGIVLLPSAPILYMPTLSNLSRSLSVLFQAMAILDVAIFTIAIQCSS